MADKLWGRLLKKRPAPCLAPPLPDTIEAIRQRAYLGHHMEQVLWGKTLLKSAYMPPNAHQARIWFTMAANAGYGPAHNMLGRCAHFGWGCPKDLLQAAVHYEAAAQCGDEWGRYNLAILTMRGLGVTQNLKKAVGLFQTAAQNGHAKSMNILARFLEEGWEIPQNRAEALLWYRRSAEGGDYRGQHNYATVLADSGQLSEALFWWEKALPDATSDILFAMRRALDKQPNTGSPALYAALLKRLENLPPSGSPSPEDTLDD